MHTPPNKSSTKSLRISCVLTLHSEGLLAHTTLRSLDEQRIYAEQYGA